MKIKEKKEFAEAEYWVGEAASSQVPVSIATICQDVDPDHSVGRDTLDDKITLQPWQREDRPEFSSASSTEFNAEARAHEAFADVRKVEASKKKRFVTIKVYLRLVLAPYREAGELLYPKFSLSTDYRNEKRQVAELLAAAFAKLVVKGTSKLADRSPEVQTLAQEIIRRQVLGIDLDADC
jgi:hypothetical protein